MMSLKIYLTYFRIFHLIIFYANTYMYSFLKSMAFITNYEIQICFPVCAKYEAIIRTYERVTDLQQFCPESNLYHKNTQRKRSYYFYNDYNSTRR